MGGLLVLFIFLLIVFTVDYLVWYNINCPKPEKKEDVVPGDKDDSSSHKASKDDDNRWLGDNQRFDPH
jgi:hypothetical protein